MVRTRFEGGAELAKAFEGLSKALTRKVLREALAEGAEPMRKRMAANAPFDPESAGPHLRDRVVIANATQAVGDGGTIASADEQQASVAVGPTKGLQSSKGGWNEFGTVHVSAEPWVRPAFDADAAMVLPIVRRACWRELSARGVSRVRTSTGGPVSGGPGGGTL